METIWYILVDRKPEGPLTFDQLCRHDMLTKKSYVWKEGMENWVHAEELPELKELFYKPLPKKEEEEEEEPEGEAAPPDGQLTLQVPGGPPFYFLWLLIALILFMTAFLVQYL